MRKYFAIFLLLSNGLFSGELSIITLFRNEAKYLKEWVEYHHMIGVDHFLLYNDRSDDNWEEVLAPYIDSNLVEVVPWHKDDVTPLFPVWQVMAYQDGLQRLTGNTKWIAFIDVDEFIVPKQNASIIECLDEHYSSASGVYLCWRCFGTGGLYIPPGEPIITQLTACSERFHSDNASGKVIIKVDDAFIEQTWSPHYIVLKEGSRYFDGSGEQLPFNEGTLQVTPRHTDDYIRINHYALRDENFYQNVRLPKAISGEYGNLALLMEHHESFDNDSDYDIIEFIKERHPSMYQTFWRGNEASEASS